MGSSFDVEFTDIVYSIEDHEFQLQLSILWLIEITRILDEVTYHDCSWCLKTERNDSQILGVSLFRSPRSVPTRAVDEGGNLSVTTNCNSKTEMQTPWTYRTQARPRLRTGKYLTNYWTWVSYRRQSEQLFPTKNLFAKVFPLSRPPLWIFHPPAVR